jgi:hypothetical protein
MYCKLIGAVFFALLLAAWTHGNSTPIPGIQASTAKSFTNTVGMGDPNNVAGTTVGSALAYMGITMVRSDVPFPGDGGSNYNYLASQGVRFNFLWANMPQTIDCSNQAGSIAAVFALINTFVATYPGAMIANEGPNETNNFPVCYANAATTTSSTPTSSAVLHFAPTPAEIVTAANATYNDGGTIHVGTGFTVTDTNTNIDPGKCFAVFSNGFSSTQQSCTVTINHASELLLVETAEGGGPITGCTDTLSSIWAKRIAQNASGAPNNFYAEEWYASGPTGGSYPQTDTITCTQTVSAEPFNLSAFGIIGANLSTPFDGSAVGGATDPLTISTSHTDTIVIGNFSGNVSSPTPIAGYAAVADTQYTLVMYQGFSTTQSGRTVGTVEGTANYANLADAVVLNSAPILAALPANTTIVSATSTSVTLNNNAINSGVQNGDTIQFTAAGVEPSTLVPVTASSIAWQAAIYNATHADSNLSGVKVANYTGFVPGATPQPPSVAGTADYNNTHFYPGGGSQPVPSTGQVSMAVALNPAFQPIPGLVTVITETGYCTGTGTAGLVDQTTQAILLLNNYLDMFSASVPYTTVYTLFDGNTGDNNCFDNYGVFESDQATPKTSATAIKSMMTILGDTASVFSPGKLNYSISGLPSGGSGGFSLLLQKTTGIWEICIWNEPQIWNDTTHSEITPPTSALTINLGFTASTVHVYDPMTGTSPIATHSSVSSVSVSITKDPLVIEAIP